MQCFYHKSDLDGHCSGAIVKLFYPKCEMIGVDYNSGLDLDSIKTGEEVFVVDFCFDKETMDRLNKKASLVWIDHHKTSIEDCDGLGIAGLRTVGRAACELVWEWFYYSIHNRALPEAIRYLGRHDVWDHSDPNTMPFQYGIRAYTNTLPGSDIWPGILHSFRPGKIDDILELGKTILAYQENQDSMIAKAMSYEAMFHGYRAIVLNRPFANSQAFKAVYDPDKHDIMILFGIKNGEVKYTLFCDKPDIDVSAIAKQYDGGGHKGAAGFYSKGIIL